jgi:hypothetical protein
VFAAVAVDNIMMAVPMPIVFFGNERQHPFATSVSV